MSLADIYKKIKPAVVAIAIVEKKGTEVSFDKIFGTGFCVDPNGIIVTARHIISAYYEKIRKEVLPKSRHEEPKPLHRPDFKIIFFRKGSNKLEALTFPVINFIFPFVSDCPEDDVAVLRIPKCPEEFGA